MEPKKAAFSFESFKFNSFQFIEPETTEYDGLSLSINPSGVYTNSDRLFKLKLDFRAFIVNNEDIEVGHDVVKLTMQSSFLLSSEANEIPDFFYANSIAIVFPYLRSFLSTLTMQANTKQILLPLLNLTHLEAPLRENTVLLD